MRSMVSNRQVSTLGTDYITRRVSVAGWYYGTLPGALLCRFGGVNATIDRPCFLGYTPRRTCPNSGDEPAGWWGGFKTPA